MCVASMYVNSNLIRADGGATHCSFLIKSYCSTLLDRKSQDGIVSPSDSHWPICACFVGECNAVLLKKNVALKGNLNAICSKKGTLTVDVFYYFSLSWICKKQLFTTFPTGHWKSSHGILIRTL